LARIECTAEGHPAPIISWLRNGIRVESGVQGIRYIAEGKVLTVIEARSSDSGIYVCEATNEAGTARQAYTLEVLVSPKIVSTSPPKISVPYGTSFSLKCGVRGYPEPVVTWSYDDVPLTGKTEGVTIGAPVISEGVRVVNTTEGEQASLTCSIIGEEHQIQWYKVNAENENSKNDAALLASSNIVFNDNKTEVNFLAARLSDEGQYSCVAENPAGKATQINHLYVGAALDDRGPAQRKSIMFEDVSLENAGVYTCKAESWAGIAQKDFDLVVIGKRLQSLVLVPPIIVPEKLDFTVELRKTVILPCNATGIPEPVVTWVKAPNIQIETNESKFKRRKALRIVMVYSIASHLIAHLR
uniref:Down syndrome cell adhesion molecule-like protein Dscam2 n=1 Tax=Heligmosomoides polygyrus TaxID=6339 RepID=A0A183GNL0_HELPZ